MVKKLLFNKLVESELVATSGNFDNINFVQGGIYGWQGYLELTMPESFRASWFWFFNADENTTKVTYRKGKTKSGINYIALKISLKDFMPITIFLYTSSDSTPRLFCPRRGNMSLYSKPMRRISKIDLPESEMVSIVKYGIPAIMSYYNQEYEQYELARCYCRYAKDLIREFSQSIPGLMRYGNYPLMAYMKDIIKFEKERILIRLEENEYDIEEDFLEMEKEFEDSVCITTI